MWRGHARWWLCVVLICINRSLMMTLLMRDKFFSHGNGVLNAAAMSILARPVSATEHVRFLRRNDNVVIGSLRWRPIRNFRSLIEEHDDYDDYNKHNDSNDHDDDNEMHKIKRQ